MGLLRTFLLICAINYAQFQVKITEKLYETYATISNGQLKLKRFSVKLGRATIPVKTKMKRESSMAGKNVTMDSHYFDLKSPMLHWCDTQRE